MGPPSPTKEDPACEWGEGPGHKEAQSGSKQVVALRSLRRFSPWRSQRAETSTNKLVQVYMGDSFLGS